MFAAGYLIVLAAVLWAWHRFNAGLKPEGASAQPAAGTNTNDGFSGEKG